MEIGKVIIPGDDAYIVALANMLHRGEITREQFNACHERMLKNPRKTEVVYYEIEKNTLPHQG